MVNRRVLDEIFSGIHRLRAAADSTAFSSEYPSLTRTETLVTGSPHPTSQKTRHPGKTIKPTSKTIRYRQTLFMAAIISNQPQELQMEAPTSIRHRPRSHSLASFAPRIKYNYGYQLQLKKHHCSTSTITFDSLRTHPLPHTPRIFRNEFSFLGN